MQINIWLFIIMGILALIGFFITALLILFSFMKFEEYPPYNDYWYDEYPDYNIEGKKHARSTHKPNTRK